MMSIILKTIFYLLSALLIYVIVKRLTYNLLYRKQLGIIMSLVFLAHPYIIFLIFSGLEQLISISFFLCFVFCFIIIHLNKKLNENRLLITCGIFLALTYLSRTDTIILLPFIFTLIFFLHNETFSRNLIATVPFITGYLIIIVPWYLFIYLNTGNLTQDSGAVKMFLNENASLPLIERFLSSFQFVNKFWWPTLNNILKPLYILFWGFSFILGLNLILNNIRVLKPYNIFNSLYKKNLNIALHQKINIQVMGLCVYYIIAIAITYGFLFSSAREWYYGLSTIAFFFLFICLFNLFIFSIKDRLLRTISIFIIALFSFFTLFNNVNNQELFLGKFTNQKEMLTVSKWMTLHLPKNAIIGSWNSGIFGFFSEKPVVNLDGLINSDILDYLKSNNLYSYIEKRNINYIIDYSVMLYWNEKYLGKTIEEIPITLDTSFSGTWFLSDISVWRITKTTSNKIK